MKVYGGVQGDKRNKWINFGGDPDHHADCPTRNLAITQQIMTRFIDAIFRIALQWYKEQMMIFNFWSF